jgi:VanZ family protein
VKYGVGDKVKIRSDLEAEQKFSDCRVTKDMEDWAGKEVEITEATTHFNRYRVKGCQRYWTDEMLESKEDKRVSIKACKLMVEAMEDPQKYEGRKYKVLDTLIDRHGKEYETATFRHGVLKVDGEMSYAHVNSITALEEIPQPVPFMEAVKAAIEGRHPTITLDDMKLRLIAEESAASEIGYWLKVKTKTGATLNISTKMMDGLWTIE